MPGHVRLWPAMAGHGQPWLATAGHDRPWPATAYHGWPWPARAGHGRPWPSLRKNAHAFPENVLELAVLTSFLADGLKQYLQLQKNVLQLTLYLPQDLVPIVQSVA